MIYIYIYVFSGTPVSSINKPDDNQIITEILLKKTSLRCIFPNSSPILSSKKII